MRGGPPIEATAVSRDQVWEALEYFVSEVVPVAEEAGVKLALHPDDPPRDEVRGIPRVVNSVENYDRVLSFADSEHHGVTLGQGNFSTRTRIEEHAGRLFLVNVISPGGSGNGSVV